MENDYLLQKKAEVQAELLSQKIMVEIKSLRDDVKKVRDDIAFLSKNMGSSEANFPSSPDARQDLQVSLPRNVPSSQNPQGFGNGGQSTGINSPRGYQQGIAQQAPSAAPQSIQMDQNQGGFTGSQVAQVASRGKGNNLPPHLSIEKMFYCGSGGKR